MAECSSHSLVEQTLVQLGHNNNLLMLFHAKVVLHECNVRAANRVLAQIGDGEASELVFITPSTSLCFPLHQEMVNAAFETHGISANTTVKLLKL